MDMDWIFKGGGKEPSLESWRTPTFEGNDGRKKVHDSLDHSSSVRRKPGKRVIMHIEGESYVHKNIQWPKGRELKTVLTGFGHMDCTK